MIGVRFARRNARGAAFLAIACALHLGVSVAAAPAGKERPAGVRFLRNVAPCPGADAPATDRAVANALLSGALLYENTGNPANTYYAGQNGAETIDDLHLVSGGVADTLAFEYYEPAAGASFTATVRIYDNPGGRDVAIAPLAGPYLVAALPSGRRLVTVPLSDHPVVGTDLWVGVRFSSATAGLIIRGTPSVGSSHDLYLENGDLYWFGGDPPANFALRIAQASSPVGVDGGEDGTRVALAAPRPNPFRAGAAFGFTIARRGAVRLAVLDPAGRRVCSLVDDVLEPGSHLARWSGRDDAGRRVAAGVYFVRLESAGSTVRRRVAFTP